MRAPFLALSLVVVLSLPAAASLAAQEPPADAGQAPRSPSDRSGRWGPGAGRQGRGLFGKISAIGSDSLEVTGNDGTRVTVRFTGGTEFRRDRQPAKASDFKVGDMVMVRTGGTTTEGTPTALLVAGGQGFGAGGPFALAGTLGKDYVVGEVKAIDPPKLTVLRPDNVSQTLELNEESSLRRSREAITMADIQPGDHVFVRGALVNDQFVPKNVTVFGPEQWKRMQEMMNGAGRPQGPEPAPGGPAVPPPPQNPPEPRR